jgi:hypothetical protein
MLVSTMTLTLQASMLHLYIRHYIWHNKQFTSHNLQSLKHNKQYDVDKKKLCAELWLLKNMLPWGIMRPINILRFLKDKDCFPNTFCIQNFIDYSVTTSSAKKVFKNWSCWCLTCGLRCHKKDLMT